MRHEDIEKKVIKHWAGVLAIGAFALGGYACMSYESDLNSVNLVMNNAILTNTTLTQSDRQDIVMYKADSRSDSDLALGSAVVGTLLLTVEGGSILLSQLKKYPPSD